MKRLLWALAGAVLAVGTASAEPPASGKERTLLEQEFHLVDQPTPKASPSGTTNRPEAPVSFVSAMSATRRWVIATAAGRLDVTLARPAVW
jgi:hypothetical protein